MAYQELASQPRMVVAESPLLVVFGNTSPAAPAMLATQWFSDHAGDAKVLLIEFPQLKKLSNDRSLLVSTTKFGDITRVFDNRVDEEKGRQSVKNRKGRIQYRVCRVGH